MHLENPTRDRRARSWALSWLLSVAVLPALASTSRAADYLQDHWDSAEGLPASSIHSLLVSQAGHLWLATFDGLVRFDGRQFSRIDDRQWPDRPLHRIRQMEQTGDGWLFLVTGDGSLMAVDGTQLHRARTDDGAEIASVDLLHAGPGGSLHVATPARLLHRESGAVFKNAGALPAHGRATAMHSDADGEAWLAVGRRLYRLAEGGLHAGPVLPHPIEALARDHTGQLWLGGAEGGWRMDTSGRVHAWPNDGLFRIEADGRTVAAIGRWRDYTLHPSGQVDADTLAPAHAGSGHQRLLARAPDGSLWRNRLNRLERDGRSVFEAPCAITGFDFDRMGHVWIGTSCAGLYRLRPRSVEALTALDGVPFGSSYGLLETADGTLWVGTLDRGVAVLEPGGAGYWIGPEAGIPAPALLALYDDPAGQLWLGPCRLHAGRLPCRAWPARPDGALRETAPQALHRDRQDRLWVAGQSLWLQEGDGPWQSMDALAGLDPDAGGQVQAILERADGSLWFATRGQGLLRRRTDGRFERFDTRSGLSSPAVRALAEDPGGGLWAVTENRGLCRLDERARPRFECLGRQHGLPSESLHQVLSDGQGRAWISSNQGIFAAPWTQLEGVLAGRAGRVHPLLLTARDGLPSTEANGGVQGSGIRLRDGRLAFPTLKGVALIDPSRIQPLPSPPRVTFEAVELPGGERIPASGPLTLPRGERSFALHFAGLAADLTSPTYFRYRLAPATRWTELGDARQLNLEGLPPGRLQLELQPFDGAGQVGDPALLIVDLPPYWHQAPLVRLALALVLLLAVVAAFGQQRRRARYRQAALSKLVHERTAELHRTLDTVRSQRDRIRQLASSREQFFTQASHELRTPLSLLVGPLEDLARGRAPGAELAAAMARNARRLETLIDQLLDLERLGAHPFPLLPQDLDLVTLAAESGATFATAAQREGIDFRIHLPSGPVPVVGDLEQITRVLANLLSNALKFCPTAGGRIRLSVGSGSDGRARLRVEDSGPGIPPAWRERIFDRFAQIRDPARRAREGTGLGLSLCREIARLHGGALRVGDSPLGGAAFVLELPAPARSPLQAPASRCAGPPTPQEPAGWLDGRSRTGPASPVAQPGAPAGRERPLVLVAEDDSDLNAYLQAILGRHYRVHAVADGRAALESIAREPPDLLITDLMMPGLDGAGLARAVRADPELAGVPIVFLTARASSADRVAGLRGDADHYLTKPFDSDVLLAQVASALRACLRLRRHLDPASRPRAAAGKRTLQQRIADLFDQHAHDPDFNVTALATALHMAPSTLRRRCQAECGDSPQALLRQHRLERARQLLVEGAGTVTEIAYGVGYCNLAAFSRAYRAHFGMPPGRHLDTAPRTR